jgi:hypothetical protein
MAALEVPFQKISTCVRMKTAVSNLAVRLINHQVAD